jgi:hypothetical protein
MANGTVFTIQTGTKVSQIIVLHFPLLTHNEGPRTQGQRYQTLCQKENDAELLGQGMSGASAFINKGIGIEADM